MRRLTLVLGLAAVWLPACGEPEPLPPEHWMARLESRDSAKADEAVHELGKWGRREPGRVVPLLERELARRGERAVLGARVEPDAAALAQQPEAMQALQTLALAVRQHLVLQGYAVLKVQADEEGVSTFVKPLAGTSDLEEGLRRLAVDAARAGAMELLPELPPPSAATAERPVSPWPRDAAAYDAWLALETKRFTEAEAAGKRYEPGEPGHVLTRRVATEAGGTAALVPLLVPATPAMRFTETDLRFEPKDDAGMPALFVSAVPAREAEFRAFLRAHAGLRLWLVVDGMATLSVPLSADPGAAFALRVNATTLGEGRTQAANLAALAAAGRYAVPVTVTPIPRTPMIAVDDPLCRAIVSVGPPAEPMLEALVAKDAAWAPLVKSLREGILRMRTQNR